MKESCISEDKKFAREQGETISLGGGRGAVFLGGAE
jgi:hypothetical protein